MGALNHTMEPKPIDAVRILLQTAQAPLDIFAELAEAAVDLLADLERPLGLIDFSPFSQWTGDEVARQPPSSMARQKGVTPATQPLTTTPSVTPRVITQGTPSALQPAMAAATTTTPVFTLASRQPLPTSTATDPGATPGDQGGAEAAALLAAMTMVDTLTAALLDTAVVVSPDLASRSSLGETTLLHQSVNGERLSAAVESGGQPPWPTRVPVEQARPQVVDPFVVNHGPPGQSLVTSTTDGAADAALTTMALLATVTEALLTTIPEAAGQQAARPRLSPTVEPLGVNWGGERTDRPAMPSGDGGQRPLTHDTGFMATPPAVGTLSAPSFQLEGERTWPSAMATPFGEPEASLSAPPSSDAWALAQLINDVLAAEARRHGVDLS